MFRAWIGRKVLHGNEQASGEDDSGNRQVCPATVRDRFLPARPTPRNRQAGQHAPARPLTQKEIPMSALRKVLELGLLFTSGPGWKLHPLGTNCILVETDSGAFLTDGERRKEYPSMEAALDTRVTRRKLMLGEAF